MTSSTVEELVWVSKLLLRNLKTGTGSSLVLRALHPSARDIFASCANLDELFHKLDECESQTGDAEHDERKTSDRGDSEDKGVQGKKKTQRGSCKRTSNIRKTPKKALSSSMVVGKPCVPMLATAAKHNAMARIIKKMRSVKTGKLAVEIKYDGERVQIHHSNSSSSPSNVRCFARSTKPVKESKVEGLREHVLNTFGNDHEYVIDSELVCCDKEGTILPFGTLGTRNKHKYGAGTYHCFIVFDVLVWHGEDVKHMPYSSRRAILENLPFSDKEVVLGQSFEAVSQDEVMDIMHERMEKGEEGIMLKNPDGPYKPKSRSAWYKLKKDYLKDGAMADGADLVVLGGYYGHGKNAGKLSTFLMGSWDAEEGVWRTVCKVGNGFTDEEVDEMDDWLRTQGSDSWSDGVRVDVHASLRPNVCVRDIRSSRVFEIIGNEFTHSDKHTAGNISIRFPRVKRRREDKEQDARPTTVHELQTLVAASSQSATAKETLDASKRKRSKVNDSTTKSARPCKKARHVVHV